jgi:hypothetical protein
MLAPWKAGSICRSVKDWNPQAVLTVAHGYSWMTAAVVADRLGIPLHLIVHDNPVASMSLPSGLTRRAELEFARIYRQAVTRLCVSPAMADAYRSQFGVESLVLYPVRDSSTPAFENPPSRLLEIGRPLTFAYAGSVSTTACSNALTALADALEPLGHRMLLFSKWGPEAIQRFRLDRPHVTIVPPAAAGCLIPQLREQADVMFVPMSFEPQEAADVQISFPSKLTDYTATGLPLLIWGPPYCSAIRWFLENPGVGEIATESTLQSLTKSIQKIGTDPSLRWKQGSAALAAGSKYFSAGEAQKVFGQVLQRPSARVRT